MALDKISKETSAQKEKQINFAECKAKRHARRTLRTGLVAAAAVCALAIPAYAAGTVLLPMLAEKIDFFQNAPSRNQVDDALEAPRGGHEGQPVLEAFNTPVGQSVTDQGITVTLDHVSMDVSGVDLFLTVEGEEAIQKLIAENDYMPSYDVVRSVIFFTDSSLNGQRLVWSDNSNDWYQQEDGSIKVIVHATLSALPEGEELTLNVKAHNILQQQGNWSITAVLDGNSVRAGAKIGESGVYARPALPAQGKLPEIKQDLNLVYTAFGPRGGVMASVCEDRQILFENGVPEYSWYDGGMPDEFMITDNTGKTLFAGWSNAYWMPDSDKPYFISDLTLPDPAATSLILTPMEVDDEKVTEDVIYTTEQLKEGVTISTGPESGFSIRNFRQEGSSFVWQQVPYGYMPHWAELIPEDGGIVSMTEESRFGLIDAVRDPHTGIYDCRLDYYVATPEEVAQIVNWSIPSSYYVPLHEQDITIPLSLLENAQ